MIKNKYTVGYSDEPMDIDSYIEYNEIVLDASDVVEILNSYQDENERLKQSNNEVIELILDGIVEMHDGKRDYAESILNKAIRLLKGDVE